MFQNQNPIPTKNKRSEVSDWKPAKIQISPQRIKIKFEIRNREKSKFHPNEYKKSKVRD
jgi:hypothetical protein